MKSSGVCLAESIKKKKMVLADAERDELHKAILEYVTAHGLSSAAAALQADLQLKPLRDFTTNQNTTLERRWNTLRRLSAKNIELEAAVTRHQKELSEWREGSKVLRGDEKNSSLLFSHTSCSYIPAEPPLVTFTGHRDSLTSVAFHPVENQLATSSEDGLIKLWDLDSKSLFRTIRSHTESVACVAYEPLSAKKLASCSADQTIKMHDADSGECLSTLYGHGDSVTCLVWVGNAEESLVSSSRNGELRLWDSKRAALLFVKRVTSWIRCLSVEGVLLAAGCDGEKVSIFSLYTSTTSGAASLSIRSEAQLNDPIAELAGHSNVVQCVCLSNRVVDEWLLENFGSAQQKTEVAAAQRKRAANKKIVQEMSGSSSHPVADTADALYTPKFVASGSRDKNIILYEIGTGTKLMELQAHENWVRQILFTANGKFLVSGGDDGFMMVFDLASRRVLKRIVAHQHFVSCVACHPRKHPWIASGSADTTVRVWSCY